MGSSPAQVTCETSQVLLAGGQVVFLGDLAFSPTLRLTQLRMSKIMLTPIKNNNNYEKIKELKKEIVSPCRKNMFQDN